MYATDNNLKTNNVNMFDGKMIWITNFEALKMIEEDNNSLCNNDVLFLHFHAQLSCLIKKLATYFVYGCVETGKRV